MAIVHAGRPSDSKIPEIPNKRIPLRHFFTHTPWVALQKDQFDIIVYPFAVGLGFLMPLDLIFSCVFFFFLYKSQYVIGSMIGLSDLPGYPFRCEQNIGAYAGVCVLLLWTIQRQIYSALRLAFGSFNAKDGSLGTASRDNLNSDENEPMRYRITCVGISAGGYLSGCFFCSCWNGFVGGNTVFCRSFYNYHHTDAYSRRDWISHPFDNFHLSPP